MKQLTALKDMAKKVEAKRTEKTPVLWLKHEAEALGWSISLTVRAYNGSLDAAHSLHNTGLSGWHWEKRRNHMFVETPDYLQPAPSGVFYARGANDNPARAWLLAIIKAKISDLEDV